MKSHNTDILLYGMPSTTFLHIKRVVEAVIQRAKLPVTLNEITNIQEILKAEIHTVPSLKIEDTVFNFSAGNESNLLLKKAIVYLLQSHNYGDWPCIALPFTDLASINTPFLYGYQLANRLQSCLELQFITADKLQNEIAFESLTKKVQMTNEEPMGQILSRPIIGHKVVHDNICDYIVQYVVDNKDRPLIVPSSVWALCDQEISEILPHLSAPLLSIGSNSSYHSKMRAEWWIDPEYVNAQTLQALLKLYSWYDLNLTIVASRKQKASVLSAIKELETHTDFSLRWVQEDGNDQISDQLENTILLLNSSNLQPQLRQAYPNLRELMDSTSHVALLPEKSPSTSRRGIRKRSHSQSTKPEYLSS